MADPSYLDRRAGEPPSSDFTALREAGIAMLQTLCGETWTDYNLHDPGVTLLEQLCYGLTDLAYRASFAAEDYLFDAGGRIDRARFALPPPEDALSCRPLTADDYKRLFADALPELRNLWIEPAGDGRLPGLLDIRFQPASGLAANETLVRKLDALYHAHRNLGEDLAEIREVDLFRYRLAGEIEIDAQRSATEVLADIYFACLELVSPPIPQRPYGVIAGTDWDRLFEGPLGHHGHIDSAAFRPWGGVSLSELTHAVGGVAGVQRVVALHLLDADGRPCAAATGDRAAWRVPYLVVPSEQADVLLDLRLAGQARPVVVSDFLDRLRRLRFAADSRRHGQSRGESISPLPTGTAAELADYTPVQHHLPPVYGLGAHAPPESASVERRAQARQLQGYLLLFDQLMANFMQGVQDWPRLFSLDEGLDRSYFHQLIDEAALPGVEALYPEGADAAAEGLRRILAHLDDFPERRGRALDFLLAMHGEHFALSALRNTYAGQAEQLEGELLRIKLAFASRAPALNARRQGAIDYRQPAGAGNVPALVEKVALLLGLDAPLGGQMTAALRASGFRHVSDAELGEIPGIEILDGLAPGEVPVARSNAPGADGFLARGLLCPSLMNGGSVLERYRIVTDSAACRLYFRLEDGRYCLLSTHPDRRSAMLEANRLSRRIARLTARTLGLHLVEHLLLRPVDPGARAADFLASRATLVLPDWSPRLRSPPFRRLAEETVFLCSPAHLHVQLLWLDFAEMEDFERLHGQWLGKKLDPAASAEDEAGRLREFLIRHAPEAGLRRV